MYRQKVERLRNTIRLLHSISFECLSTVEELEAAITKMVSQVEDISDYKVKALDRRTAQTIVNFQAAFDRAIQEFYRS
jgi:hypothetical protein